MAQKGLLTTADYLPKDEYDRFIECLHRDKRYNWELFCLVSFCAALRVSDVRLTKWSDILDKEQLVKVEKKTDKNRTIKLNREVMSKIKELYRLLGNPDINLSIIANPKTGEPFSTKYINQMLKVFRFDYNLKIKNFSTHTFRKTFGRFVYESMGRSAEALILLNTIFKHSSIEITKVYIGIRQEEIDGVYDLITLKPAS